jgi:hypothetical protein
LRSGDSIELAGGKVQVADLRVWMAYQIDYQPFLPWMLVAALLAIIGLCMHFASRYLSASATASAGTKEGDYAYVTGL